MHMVKDWQQEIDEFYKNAYRAYYRIQLGDQDKQWAPHFICKYCKKTCVSGQMELEDRLVLEQQNYHDHCYFCMVGSVKGFNKKNRKSIILYRISFSKHYHTTCSTINYCSCSNLQRIRRRKRK